MGLYGKSIFLELTPYTCASEEAEYLIVHDITVMKVVPVIFIPRSGINILDDEGLHMFREEGDECDLGWFIEVVKYIDHDRGIVSLKTRETLSYKIAFEKGYIRR